MKANNKFVWLILLAGWVISCQVSGASCGQYSATVLPLTHKTKDVEPPKEEICYTINTLTDKQDQAKDLSFAIV